MTYNIELTDKPDKRGLHHVMIRLHATGHKPARIQTEIELQTRHWNKNKAWGKWVRSTHPNAETINNNITKEYNKVKEAVQKFLASNPSTSPSEAKKRYDNNAGTLLRSLMPAVRPGGELSIATSDARQYEWNAFIQWAGEDISIESINPNLLNRYKTFLLAKGREPSTINAYMAQLRILYEAAQRERGISRREMLALSPFLELENLKVVPKTKGRLNQEMIDKMPVGGYEFTRRGTRLGNPGRTFYNWDDWGRWCWLASHHQAGMRIGDLIRSRYEWYDVDAAGQPVRLRYQMQKNGRLISIPLSGQMRAHLAHVWVAGSKPETYLLPFLDNSASYARYRTYEQVRSMPLVDARKLKSAVGSTTVSLNRGLAKVVIDREIKVAGGRALSNHTARHSFGDKVRRAIKEGKTDSKGRPITAFDAKDLFGHGRLQTTEIYFGEMDQDWLDSAMDALNEEG